MNCIELFTGAGGLAKGLELAGAHHLAFVEWDCDACKTLRENYAPADVYEGDVRDFPFYNYKNVDVIAGGPPCQPFSLGGKAQGNHDKRDMFPPAISAIRTLMPKAFIFENVKGLLRKSFTEYFKYILLQLKYPQTVPSSTNWKENLRVLEETDLQREKQPIRYDVSYTLVNAADYGIPQNRERVIIVGFRSDLNIDWAFPAATHSKDALLWSMFVSSKYWKRHDIPNYFSTETKKAQARALLDKYGFFEPELKPWKTVRDALTGLGEPNGKGDHIFRSGAKEYTGHTGSCIDAPSKTIKAGSHGVPGGENMIKFQDGTVRYYSVAEAKRIQTFPDSYVIKGAWSEAMRQLGNAVPVELAEIIAKSIFKAIEYRNTDKHEQAYISQLTEVS